MTFDIEFIFWKNVGAVGARREIRENKLLD